MTALVYDQDKELQETRKEVENLRKMVSAMQAEKKENEANKLDHVKVAKVFDFANLRQPESSKSQKSWSKETVQSLQKRRKEITARIPQLTG